MMLRYWTAVGFVERAVATVLVAGALGLSGCSGPAEKEKVTKEHLERLPKIKEKRKEAPKKQGALEPLVSPDCAAPLPALTAAPSKVQEADGLRAAATAGPAVLTAGPILGDVSDQGVTVWISADRPAPWQVSVAPAKQPKNKQVIEGSALTAESDFTAAVRLDKLTASTAYEYEVRLGIGPDAVKATGSFHTLSAAGKPGKVRIAVGARLAADPEQPIFTEIGALKPDVFMLLGDLIYSSNLKASFPAYADKYREIWSITQLKALLKNVPTYTIWNDQDIKDDYFAGSSKNRYEPARLAFDLYAQAHNPKPVRDGQLYFQFQVGEVSVFMLDVRTHRTDPEEKGQDKTMLGAEQKADLARFLKCAPGKVKVVATPVAFSNQIRSKGAWRDYEPERRQLISFIEKEKVDNVIMLTGDQSWSALLVHNHKQTRFFELMAAPLSKELAKAPNTPSKGIVARDDDNHVFGIVDIDTTVDPVAIALTVCAKGKPCKPGEEKPPASDLDQEGDKETVPYTLKITADEIGPLDQIVKPAEPKPTSPPAHPATGAN